jgi:anti-sigma factor RsiW
MSCEGYDWKGYALGELSATDRREAEEHAAGCEGCRGELAQVRLMVDTLGALREEEVPRRIAFVSDKVFEPRWWQVFLRPASFSPMLAAALVIAAAIVVHGYLMRPVEDSAEMQARINQAVTRAVADVARHNAELQTQMTTLYVANTGIKYQ